MIQDQIMDNMPYTSNLNSPSQPYSYMPTAPPRHSDRPRPSSARDPVYFDLLEGSFHNQRETQQVINSFYDGRAASVDRGPNHQGGNRGYYSGSSQRYNQTAYPPGYPYGQNPSYQPSVSLFSAAQATGQRRAQSYDMNLERHGLYEYNSSLMPPGVGINHGSYSVYGNRGNERIDELGAGVSLMTPVAGFNNPSGVASYGGYGGVSNSSGVMTLSNSVDVVNIQRECVRLHQELDVTREKLNACMTSIRTFWSPELKRERAMRKEENAKYAILADHLHQLQLEKQTMLQALHNSDADLRREREKNASRFKMGPDGNEVNEFEVMRRRIDELTCENCLLSKSIEEAEKRASSLQASLITTEESLRRLVEAVKSGKAVTAQQQSGQQQQQQIGGGSKADQALAPVGDSGLASIRIDRLESDRNEIGRLREQLNEAFHRESEAEKALVECEMTRNQLKDELDGVSQDYDALKHENEGLRLNLREVQTLQAIVDTKESKILTLENEIRLLEDEIARLRDEGIVTPTTSLSSGIEDVDRTLNTFRSNERLLKSKVEFLTSELSKRDNEIYALQSRLEMAEKQQQDQNHHISVLKEQVKARENKVSMLTADIEDFRKRLKEKEGLLEKKTKLVASNATGKRQLETELAELKDQVDLKERKISLLQRKVENLEEMVTEKETQLASLKSRLSRLSNEKIGTEGPKASLEDTLKEKDRQIERLKDARERNEAEWAEEAEGQRRIQLELRERLDTALRDLDEKSAQLSEALEEVAQLRSSRYKRDTEVSQLQAQLRQRDAEMSSLQLAKQLLHKQVANETEMKYAKTVAELESQVNHYTESASKLQSEVDRLLNMIRTCDSDKLDKDNQIHELEEQLHEAQNQIGSLKRSQQADRKKNSQVLDEARHRADTFQNDAELLKNVIAEKEVRVRELEQALRESVRLTAEREAHVASREDSTRQLEHQFRELHSTVEHLQRERNNLSSQLVSLQEELRDRESQLKNLKAECVSFTPLVHGEHKWKLWAQMRGVKVHAATKNSDSGGGKPEAETQRQRIFLQGYIPELERLCCANQEANLRIAALVKLVQGDEEHLTEQDKSALATFPLYPSLAHKTAVSTGPLAKTQTRLGHPSVPGATQTGFLAPGGSISPHLSGSAFHLIGSSSATAAATAATLTAGGINLPMQSADSILLGRLLHEKETMLQQQLQDLTRLRFQNSEMEVRIKSLQRELDNKTSRLNALEVAQLTAGVSGLVDWQSQIAGMPIAQAELVTLRQANTEMREKLLQLQTSLQERENELIRVQRMQSSSSTLEIERLKLELTKLKDERESIERTLRLKNTRASDELARVNTAASAVETELQEKGDKISLLEFEKTKLNSDLESLQKKYHTVIGQLTEKTDRLQQMGRDCDKNHITEIQRLTKDSDELNNRVTYLHKALQEREGKLEQQETELARQKVESANAKKKTHSLESELKSLREEITYKDERLRQLQVQHAEELSRMRSVQQEQGSRLNHLQLTIDEKDHEFKTVQGDLDKTKSDLEYTKNRLQEVEAERTQINTELTEKVDKLRTMELECESRADEMARLQSSLEESKSKANILQKRTDEQEQRLRKLENENHNLLDEIHGLRKRNHELGSHIAVLRQRLLDRGEQAMPFASSSPSAERFSQSIAEKPSTKLTVEAGSLRKRNAELENELHSLRERTQDLQIQVDKLSYERENLNKSYEEEMKKRVQLESSITKQSETVKFPQTPSAEVEELHLAVKHLKGELGRKNSQIEQLTQQLDQAVKLSQLASVSGVDRDAFVTELKLNLQRTQQALDAANDQNRVLQARNESALFESQQQHLIQRQTLQEQMSALNQSLNEMNIQNEGLQREVQQSSGRIQELTRQLRETQTNCDSIAIQRDNLQNRLEQLQQSGGGMRSYNISGGSYLGRPASVAAGYSDLMLLTTGGTSSDSTTTGVQLSRELARLHREQEVMRNQLDTAEHSARQFKQEAEAAKCEATRLREDLRQQQETVKEMKENLRNSKDEATKKITAETERYKQQHEELEKQLRNLQEQLSAKGVLVEQLTNQLKTSQDKCKQFEQKLLQMNQQIESLNAQQDQVAFERNQQQRLSYELETIKKELSIRENQFIQLTQKFDQSLKDASDQSQVIKELSRQLEAAKTTQRAAVEVENAHHQAAAWATEQSANAEQSQQDHETIAALKADLQNVMKAKDTAEKRIQKLENSLQSQTKALDVAVDQAHITVEVCKREHLTLIDNLSRENQDLKMALNEANQAHSRSTSFDEPASQSLKKEVDVLKKELDKRDVVITKLEKECQEKHVRKLEALQVQLRRYEEETANMNRVLDEQRKGIEERDRLVRQLRAECQKNGGAAELEKLQAEHARCSQQIQQKQQQLETLMKQLEQQAEEILTTKIEALTASLCEKDANLALIQTTKLQNVASNQAVQKLNNEKETIQTQLRQLTLARDALAEQRKTIG
ncbi:ELKS:Rab6 interacting:CAST family [Echinococcus multilocularis]|uniref:ELKS:Rab6 interacting:CAST family n=1 Tax=Echinococcus multilocularis TaxID=6211 RepID=A0A068YBM4_ECHMU|nr:ELKS:Rab6 interacting:CAST family [Echinococcus multilocularis]